MGAIKIIDLTKRYKDITAVDHLNLTINEGELFSLLGVNGAGKTTTIKMLSCLINSTSGNALLNGKSILNESKLIRNFVSISPQETAIAFNLTVKENLKLMTGIYGFSSKKADIKINELIKQFDLSEVMNKKAGKLSGGYQRRLSIAMALISEPKTLFLDEPTLGLDVVARNNLWNIILSLKSKITIILTTHYMEEAEALSDRVGIMKDGKLLLVDTPNNIKEITKTDKFDEAFIRIIKEYEK